jgi:hypothetical protein
MITFMNKLGRAILLTSLLFALCAGKVQTVDYAKLLGQKVRGTPGQKASAEKALRKWSRVYGVSERKMYRVFRRETGGKFHPTAFNRRTEARGLGQMTEDALRDIPEGHRYYKTVDHVFKIEGVEYTVERRVLVKARIYSCWWNIRASCSYMAICERRAPTVHKYLPYWMKLKVNEERTSILLYCYGYGNLKEFLSAINYAEEF